MSSIPEPSPLNKGYEVTPLLLDWLQQNGASDPTISLINARRLYGLQKYGQSLMTEDGRNTMEDAKQEAGDLLQYLYKSFLRGERPSSEDISQLKEVLKYCEIVVSILESRIVL